jgi:hypothetical protein
MRETPDCIAAIAGCRLVCTRKPAGFNGIESAGTNGAARGADDATG